MYIVIIDCFDTWEQRVELLMKVLKEEGHRVTALLSDYRHIEKIRRMEEPKEDSVFFSALPYKMNISVQRLYSHRQLSEDMFEWVEEREKDIDLLWVLAPPNSFVAGAYHVKQRHPHIHLIIDLIDLWPETMPVGGANWLMRPWRRMRDKNLKAADVIVTECYLYQKVLNRVLDNCKVKTLYLAREDKGYKPDLHLQDDRIALCYLGSINNIIDINAIGEVIRECKRQKPVVLRIIGDGEKKNKLKWAAKNAGAEVVDYGKVYKRELKQHIFNSCHFGLNIMKPSVCVGLTMKSIDYFEFGLPIINNIKGDTWDVVEKYGCGINLKGGSIITANIEMRRNSRLFFEKYLTEDVFKRNVLQIIA